MIGKIQIGLIGDSDPKRSSHRATCEALLQVAAHLGVRAELTWLPTIPLERNRAAGLDKFNGLWCAPGSPYRSMDGALNAIGFARESDVPFIATCGGFQHVVIEFARNILGVSEAEHEEYKPEASILFVRRLPCSLAGRTEAVYLTAGSRARAIYGKDQVEEVYACSFGLNPAYREAIEKGGLRVTGVDAAGQARILELPENRFFMSTLFLPQLGSTVANPHPLIVSFIKNAARFRARER